MGDAMEEGTILRWLKKEGDHVEEEEIVAEINTEKASIEIPSSDAGILTRILVKEGETVPVGSAIAIIGEPSSNGTAAPSQAAAQAPAAQTPAVQKAEDLSPQAHAVPRPAADLNQTPAPTGQVSPAGQPEGAGGGGRIKASPLARKVAAEHGVDLQSVSGSGPGGRIIEVDVTDALRGQKAAPATPTRAVTAPSAATAAPAAVPGQSRPNSPMRRVIAKRLSQSKQTIPHFYLTIDVDMRAAVKLRTEFNVGVEEAEKISFNDLVLRAAVVALKKFPQLYSQWGEDAVTTPGQINLGVAVSLEEGLIVPVIKNAGEKSISQLGREVRELAGRARKGGLKPDEYAGGTFTVSNLGMYDITQFQAIINPPEAAILAVGAIRDTPVVDGGQVVPGKQMFLTISVDHRVVDGSVAAQFMQELKKRLQSPLSLLG